ncbi:MAG: ribonuclease P protein component [Pseudorhodobacter sp. PARRP1]|nr:MAG: ribonuclease P protein component [Pseudorhodobacter sp. PARRP1]
MTPPKVSDIGTTADASEAPPAVCVCVETMKNRPDYLRTAQGRRQGTGSFLLQGRARGDDQPLVRIGFTASKKIGNAVARNRAKRRMRALAHQILPTLARPGWDYVLVAKPEATISRDYKDMLEDLASALTSVHRART